MMATSRSIKRAADRKRKKESKKAMGAVSNKLNKMPKSCDECDKPFIKGDSACLEWKIAVYDDGPVNLVCPDCVPESVKSQL